MASTLGPAAKSSLIPELRGVILKSTKEIQMKDLGGVRDSLDLADRFVEGMSREEATRCGSLEQSLKEGLPRCAACHTPLRPVRPTPAQVALLMEDFSTELFLVRSAHPAYSRVCRRCGELHRLGWIVVQCRGCGMRKIASPAEPRLTRWRVRGWECPLCYQARQRRVSWER